MTSIHRRRKLIEVALPLETINTESAREQSIRHGHPSTLHLWWARRPLATARAVLFAQLVDDPSAVLASERPDLKPLVGKQLTVIAWLWARTVKSPNLAFAHVDVPLVATWMLSTKPGKEAYVEPVIAGDTYGFTVTIGKPQDPERVKRGTKLARGANFECLLSGMPITGDYIKAEGRAGRMGMRLLAIVAEGPRGRVYLLPIAEHEVIARQAQPTWKPEEPLHGKARDQMPLYGIETFADLFTPRQLVALTTFADLVGEAMERVKVDYGNAPSAEHSGTEGHSATTDSQRTSTQPGQCRIGGSGSTQRADRYTS